MPPKYARNPEHNNQNKKSIPELRVPSKTINMNSVNSLDSEIEDQIELELCWCIQQLETSLTSGKLQEKQVQDLNKHIHSLKSNTTPLIKKRQIMRNTLGDYKKKMVEDERKYNKTVLFAKFTSPASVNKKSIFIKKAFQPSSQEFKEELKKQEDNYKIQNALVNSKQAIIDNNRTQISFQFNFQTC